MKRQGWMHGMRATARATRDAARRAALVGGLIAFVPCVHAQAEQPATSATSASSAGPGLVSKILRSLWLQSPPGLQGNTAYRKGDFAGALRAYAQAGAEARAGGKPVDPGLSLNAGHALYRQGNFGEAAEAYGRALSGSRLSTARDSAFASRAHYDLGNALYRKGAAADPSALDQAIADLRESLAHYKKSLQLRSSNRDAKQNLEHAQTLLQELLKKQEQRPKDPKNPKPPEPSARAKEALARALQLAQQRKYPEAKAVLEDILRTDPTAAPYRSHLQRLDDVIRIRNGQDPLPPAPADPRARQKGLAI